MHVYVCVRVAIKLVTARAFPVSFLLVSLCYSLYSSIRARLLKDHCRDILLSHVLIIF